MNVTNLHNVTQQNHYIGQIAAAREGIKLLTVAAMGEGGVKNHWKSADVFMHGPYQFGPPNY